MWYYVTLNLFICLSKIQQVLLGIFAGPLNLLKSLVKVVGRQGLEPRTTLLKRTFSAVIFTGFDYALILFEFVKEIYLLSSLFRRSRPSSISE